MISEKIFITIICLLFSITTVFANDHYDIASISPAEQQLLLLNRGQLNATKNNNELEIIASNFVVEDNLKITNLKFIEKWHAITQGQPYGGTNIRTRDGEYKIIVHAGREKSKYVVEQVCEYLGAKSDHCEDKWIFNETPGELNFAVCGDLSFDAERGYSKDIGKYNIKNICIAQGSTFFSNNWWVASKKGYSKMLCNISYSRHSGRVSVKDLNTIDTGDFSYIYRDGDVNKIHILTDRVCRSKK